MSSEARREEREERKEMIHLIEGYKHVQFTGLVETSLCGSRSSVDKQRERENTYKSVRVEDIQLYAGTLYTGDFAYTRIHVQIPSLVQHSLASPCGSMIVQYKKTAQENKSA